MLRHQRRRLRFLSPSPSGVTLRFDALIPARDEERLLPQTLDSLRRIPGLDRIVVIDDGSRDSTAGLAVARGATVVRRYPSAGKGAALLCGLRLLRPRRTPVLLADADLGASAALLAPLLDGLDDDHPMTVAAFRGGPSGGGFGLVKNLARRAISARNSLGFVPAEPLSGQRALLPGALDLLPGLAPGFGCEVGMTLDLLGAGFSPRELPLPLTHRPTGKTPAGFSHRARQGLDVVRALAGERLPW